MRPALFLALVALGLPTAALAGSINLSSGTFVSGTITGNFTNPFSVNLVGSTNTFVLSGVSISGSCTPTCFFSNGTLEVTPNGSTIPIFTSALTNGTISTSTLGTPFNIVITTISANLVPAGIVTGGIMSITAVTTTSDINTLIGTVGTVRATTLIPEPSTLGLLGTGLIGLAGMARRKLRLDR